LLKKQPDGQHGLQIHIKETMHKTKILIQHITPTQGADMSSLQTET